MSPPLVVSGTIGPFFKEELTVEQVQKYFDLLKANHVTHVDVARGYGNAEKNFGQIDFNSQGFIFDTKVKSFEPGSHTADKVHASFELSLQLLNVKKVHILYLHAPDRATPFEEPLRAFNEIYQKGGFEKFGLSNYSAKDIEEILAITDKNGWVRPTVYQGSYNILSRKNEKELFPLLRKENIAFYAYSPLAAGLLVGNVRHKDQEIRPGSRFQVVPSYKNAYFKDAIFEAITEYLEEVKKFDLSPNEVAVRWILHHSILSGEFGDAVIFGGASFEQAQENIVEYKKGPLPIELAHFIDRLWEKIEKDAPNYHL
eukprot:TRINITY_DN2047_c0_g1_i2.p1 TRINITY_DN2047_c0_g1~~TRINITY_DN2047_c0_g1_i2.p1  ORF type:complete len:314 (-),score=79.23 TRINITY_DN2047_c0_g1_i2:163-1104(-)